MSRHDIVMASLGVTINVTFALFVALLIAVSLRFPALAEEMRDDGGGLTSYGGSQASQTLPSQPVPQFAHPDQLGYINWNKNRIEGGDTVYILPTTTTLDSNGYVPLWVFQSATIGICTYVREKAFHPEFSPYTTYITYYEFSISGKVRTYRTEKIIPQQKVLFYNLP